jgi:hypothetical protein
MNSKELTDLLGYKDCAYIRPPQLLESILSSYPQRTDVGLKRIENEPYIAGIYFPSVGSNIRRLYFAMIYFMEHRTRRIRGKAFETAAANLPRQSIPPTPEVNFLPDPELGAYIARHLIKWPRVSKQGGSLRRGSRPPRDLA